MGNYKLLEYFENDTVQLFDLSSDLGEQHDLAAAQPAKVAELRSRLPAASPGPLASRAAVLGGLAPPCVQDAAPRAEAALLVQDTDFGHRDSAPLA